MAFPLAREWFTPLNDPPEYAMQPIYVADRAGHASPVTPTLPRRQRAFLLSEDSVRLWDWLLSGRLISGQGLR